MHIHYTNDIQIYIFDILNGYLHECVKYDLVMSYDLHTVSVVWGGTLGNGIPLITLNMKIVWVDFLPRMPCEQV